VHRIQAAIDAEHDDEEVPSQREPNTEPIPVVTDSGPATNQAEDPSATSEGAAKAPRAMKRSRAEEPLRAAAALRAAAELRAAEKPRDGRPPRAEEPRSAAGRLRPEEPVRAPEPVAVREPEPVAAREPARAEEPLVAPDPVHVPEPVRAEEPEIAPEPVRPPEQVRAPEPVRPPEQARTPEPVIASPPVIAPQPVVGPEPPRRAEPNAGKWPVESAPGTIGWLWPEETAQRGGGNGRYRPPGQMTGSGRWRYRTATLVAVGAVVLAGGGIAIGMSLRGHAGTPAAGGKPSASVTTDPSTTPTHLPTSPPGNLVPPASGPLGVSSEAAAEWVWGQVSPGTTVACDPQMCSALRRGGLNPAGEVQMRTNSQSLSGATLVAVTPVLRHLFAMRPSLGADVAPVILARFGSGRALVTIQPAAPNGAAAYQTAFNQAVRKRVQECQDLLNSGKVFPAPKARAALAAGEVDPRLLLVMEALIRQPEVGQVRISAFNNSGPGAGRGVPYRTANLVAVNLYVHEPASLYRQQMIALLRAHATFPPFSHAQPVNLANGQIAVSITYPVPSPLGVPGG